MKRCDLRLLTPLAVIFLSGICATDAGAMASKPNPYAYDVSAYERIPEALIRYREEPSIPAGVDQPRAIAADAAGRIYVAGATELAITDTAGKPAGRFKLATGAHCLAVAESGDILVGTTDHVDVYSPTGEPRVSWVSLGEKAILTSIAAGRGLVFVADAGNRVVWRLDASGRLLGSIGAAEDGRASKHFVIPSPYFDVAVGANRGLWIANPGKALLEKYTLDGKFVSSWGKSSMQLEGFCGCCNPVHIALRPDGAFITSEKGLPRIKVYDANGKLAAVVAGPDALAEGGPAPDPAMACSVRGPGLDLAVDGSGRVLALDEINRVIRVFVEKADAPGEKTI